MSTDDSFKKNRRFSRLAPTILLLRIDDSFRKHRRLFFKSPWMLGEVNQLHFQKESFPAFTGLFFSSSTESADNLTEVILHQQTPPTRPSCFFLTSSTCHPKFVGEERCDALMTFHEHCFADCLLVLRKVYLYCYDCLCERQYFVDAHPYL